MFPLYGAVHMPFLPFLCFYIIIIIIVMITIESAVKGRERERTLYQSDGPKPTQTTHGRKKRRK